MARKTDSFIDLHAEKIVLGVCGLAFVAAVVYSFGGMRFKVNDLGPAALVEEAGKQADATARAFATARPPKTGAEAPGKPGSNAVDDLRKWFSGPDSLSKIAQIETKPPRTQKFPWLRVGIAYVAPEDRKELVRLVPPSIPLVMAERAALEIKPPQSIQDVTPAAPTEGAVKTATLNFVSIAAQVDLNQQNMNFSMAKYPDHQKLSFTRVYLQRRDEGEPSRGWQDVETYLPFKPLVKPAVGETGDGKAPSLSDFTRFVKDAQKLITLTDLPSKQRLQYPPVPLLDEWPPKAVESGKAEEANRRVRKWTELAKKALGGKKPFSAVDLDAACMLAQAAVDEPGVGEKEAESAKKLLDEVMGKLPKARKAEWERQRCQASQLMPIMAHDLGVEPGRTYVYRMSYEVLNIYAGVTGELKNAEDAKVVTLRSGWSLPSRPVEVSSDLMFFLAQADPTKKDVTVTVYRKTRTGWKDQEYKVKVGETIGQKEKLGKNKGVDFATGLVCVDIDFDRLDPVPGGKKTAVMVYTDPAEGRLRERYLTRDRKEKDKLAKQIGATANAVKSPAAE
jgi:hypothetical protein